MKLKNIKTLIFLMIFVVFAAGSIYNYKKPSSEPPEIIQFFDKETEAADQAPKTADIETVPDNDAVDYSDFGALNEQDRININTASQAELESLPGIGPVKAKAIIEYRIKYRGFVALEEIMEVRGIGPVTYEKIKDRIKIND